MNGPKYSQYDRVGGVYCDADAPARDDLNAHQAGFHPNQRPFHACLAMSRFLHAFASNHHLYPSQIGLC